MATYKVRPYMNFAVGEISLHGVSREDFERIESVFTEIRDIRGGKVGIFKIGDMCFNIYTDD